MTIFMCTAFRSNFARSTQTAVSPCTVHDSLWKLLINQESEILSNKKKTIACHILNSIVLHFRPLTVEQQEDAFTLNSEILWVPSMWPMLSIIFYVTYVINHLLCDLCYQSSFHLFMPFIMMNTDCMVLVATTKFMVLSHTPKWCLLRVECGRCTATCIPKSLHQPSLHSSNEAMHVRRI